SNNTCGRYGDDVRTFESRSRFLLCDDVNARERPSQSGDRFQVSKDTYFLAIGDSALNAAGSVCRSSKSALGGIISDFVVYSRTCGPAHLNSHSNFNCFYCRYAHNCLRQASVELLIPLYMASEAGNHAASDDLENAS